MAINSNSNLTNSYVTAISLKTSELLPGMINLPRMLAPVVDERPKGLGSSVTVLRDPKGTVRDVNDDLSTSNTLDAPTQGSDEVSLDYYRTVGFNWGQKDQVIADTTITIDRYSQAGSIQLAADIETKTLQDVLDDPNIPAGNEIGTVGTALNLSALSSIEQKFTENGVIDPNDRWLVLSPKHYKELLDINALQSSDFVPQGSIESGVLVARLYGMTLVRSPFLAANSSLSSVTGTDSSLISVALDRKSVVFTMARIEEPATTNGIDFAQENIDGYMAASYIWFEGNTKTNKMSIDAIFGVKVVKNPSVLSATDVTNVFPILGGEA